MTPLSRRGFLDVIAVWAECWPSEGPPDEALLERQGGDDGGARRASRLSTLRASFSGLREFLHDLALFRASSMFTDGPDTSISARHG